MKNRKERCFTLSEVIIGSALLVVFLGGLFAFYQNFSRTVKGISEFSQSQQLSLRILKQFAQDAKNTMKILSSSETSILLRTQGDDQNAEDIFWNFDSTSRTIYRESSGIKNDFASGNLVSAVKIVVHNGLESDCEETVSGDKIVCYKNRLVFDIGLVVNTRKAGNGFFRRVYSRAAEKRVKF